MFKWLPCLEGIKTKEVYDEKAHMGNSADIITNRMFSNAHLIKAREIWKW